MVLVKLLLADEVVFTAQPAEQFAGCAAVDAYHHGLPLTFWKPHRLVEVLVLLSKAKLKKTAMFETLPCQEAR